MKAAASYGRSLDEIKDLNSPAGKAAQKSIKYKAYETLEQR
jgi:hypothetical protein